MTDEAPKTLGDAEWRLLKDIQGWGNSVTFCMHERGVRVTDAEASVSQCSDPWLFRVGTRIIAAADELLRLKRVRESAGVPPPPTLSPFELAEWSERIERAIYGKIGNTLTPHQIAAIQSVVEAIYAKGVPPPPPQEAKK